MSSYRKTKELYIAPQKYSVLYERAMVFIVS